jgi:hypothetical protein
MMLMETLRAELERVDKNIKRLRWRRSMIFVIFLINWPNQKRSHIMPQIEAINADIRFWKRYRKTLF